ncbi:MAG: hypothetical protein EOP83_21335 [Verrucomicrobiaceae bacterium]|nr:MAG: hypothetical protein EOP83_21335 [Verrucomicrobiaceae bacterium]
MDQDIEQDTRAGARALFSQSAGKRLHVPPLRGHICPLSVTAMQMFHYARETVYVVRREWDEYRAFPDMPYDVDALAEHVEEERRVILRHDLIRLKYAAVSRLQYEHSAIWFEFFFLPLGLRMIKELIQGFVWDFDACDIDMRATNLFWTTRISSTSFRDDPVFRHVRLMRDPRLEHLKAEAFHQTLKIWTPETTR